MDTHAMEQYQLWRKAVGAAKETPDRTLFDPAVLKELEAMNDDPSARKEAFYRDLTFGTGGLRGILGAGTARMNVYTVAKASQGLADYIKSSSSTPKETPTIAIGYDSRVNSRLFAQVAAGVFAANGLASAIYPRLMPTPCLSFAVRHLTCAAGVMVTASHNPAKYNGYKVYASDGCQITVGAAAAIQARIQKLDLFADVRWIPFEEGIKNGQIRYIPDAVCTAYTEEVKKQSLLVKGLPVCKDISIVYSPLNGTGLEPVLRVLKESGYTSVTVVKEQAQSDGTFPTCPYPNPEEEEAMALGLKYARACQADLFLATDPDCDRVGIAARGRDGGYTRLSANETGLLLLDYICSRRTAMGTMPKDPLLYKTIVTTELARPIADHYGVRTVDVLTGFKFIGEQIGILEAAGRLDSYVFGFEESYGYLSGTYVRDKDGVNAVLLICEMAAVYKAEGICLPEKLAALYRTYGCCLDTLHAYTFEGSAGADRMAQIMGMLRDEGTVVETDGAVAEIDGAVVETDGAVVEIDGAVVETEPAAGSESRSPQPAPPGPLRQVGPKKVLACLDYSQGLNGLPKSDVLRFLLEDHCSLVVRPSGTEPKLKVYISVRADDMEGAKKVEKEIAEGLSELFR